MRTIPLSSHLNMVSEAFLELGRYLEMNTPKECHLECIKSIIISWGEFQGMVAQGCAGASSKEKAAWLPTAIFEWIWHPKNSDADACELEDIFDDILNAEFNLQISDDSVIQVCNKILDARALCLHGRWDEAKQNYCTAPKVLPSFVRENAESSSEDEDDDEEDMEVEEPPQLVSATDKSQEKKDSKPKVDEDGWETVSSRKTRQK